MYMDLFIVLFIVAFIFQVIVFLYHDKIKEPRPLFAVAIGLWFLLQLNAIALEVPYYNPVDNAEGSYVYTEYGLNAFMLVFIFLNVLYWYSWQLQIREKMKYDKKRIL